MNNTLNTGDDLEATGAAAGTTALNFTAVLGTAGLLANSGYATGVTMNGVSTLNTTNQASVLGIGALPSGFQGNITGLTTVNDGYNGIGSVAGVQLGNFNQGLNTALQTVNINQFAGNPTVFGLGVLPVFAADIKAGIAAPNLTVNLNGNIGATKGPLATGGAAIISIASDGALGTVTAPNTSYVTQTYNTGTNTATYLQLEAQSGGFLGAILAAPSVDGTTNFVFKGAGTLAVGQDVAGDHQLAQNIDASGTTGSVFITGAASGLAKGNAIATGANPGALFGSAAGFLDNGADGIFGLTTFELGTGTTYFDASNANAAEIKALATTATTPAVNNEIVVNDSVATTTSPDTFKNIAGFSILGIGGAASATDGAGASGGTIDMNMLPKSIEEIRYQTTDNGTGVTIINQKAELTVNVEDNAKGVGDTLTVTAVGAQTFNLVLGNPLHTTGGAPTGVGQGTLGDVTLTNDNIFNIAAAGTGTGPTHSDSIGYVNLTPTSPGTETVNIGDVTNSTGNTYHSTQDLVIGTTANGGIADVSPITGLLNPINLTINDTSSGKVELVDQTGGGLLNFIAPGDSVGSGNGVVGLSYSTNAFTIDASKSGGLIMDGGDAQFVTNVAVAASVGDNLTGSTTKGNVLGGSIGNDAISAVNNAANTIYTDGGQDTIVLSSSHTAHNVIDIYAGEGPTGPAVVPGSDIAPISNSITDNMNRSELGWSGLGTGGTAIEFGGAQGVPGASGVIPLVPTFVVVGSGGTSADMSLIQNSTGGLGFNVATDSLGFAATAWGRAITNGHNSEGGVNYGLTLGDLTSQVGSHAAVSAQVITLGSLANAGDTLSAATNLIELNGVYTGGALQLANTLINGASQIFLSPPGGMLASSDAHMLLAYENNGSVRIADVTFEAGGGNLVSTGVAGLPGASSSIHVTDLVQLTGVSLASFEAHATTAVHFV